MSAAATAAGYLYASGRLRGKGAREGAEAEQPKEPAAEKPRRRELRVAVYAPEHAPELRRPQAGPKKTPKIEYRTRRWRPE
jgi:hypothetical protein